MDLPDIRRQGAPHDQPHDDLGSLQAAEPGVIGMGHLGQLHRILFDHFQELHVPRRVVEPGALAVHLMRHATCCDDRDVQVLGVALDRLA